MLHNSYKIVQMFDNLSSNEKINQWIKESYAECKASYPLPTRGRIAFDIGANVGGFCIHAHKTFDKIYAFEPLIENYNILCKVIESLGIKNVEVFNTAVYSESNKILPLRVYDEDHTKDVTCADFNSEKTKAIGQQCETISLKDAIESLGIDKIDYLKLDCEGSEYEILENFYDYDKISLICMEIHGFYGDERKNNLIKMLQRFYHVTDLNRLKSGEWTLKDVIESSKESNINGFKETYNILMINKEKE